MDLLIFYIVIAFSFGAIIGSFLNVLIYRFHTGNSINGSSHCLSCQRQLRWYELLPLFSYLVLRGRCRTCGAYIPVRYVVVELCMAVILAWLITLGLSWLMFVLLGLIMATLLVITVYDIQHTIIPNELVVFLVVCTALLLGYEQWQNFDPITSVFDILAGLVAFCFFGSLWYFSQGRWVGLGDAKLAFPLGILVGISGVFSMLVLSFWVGAGISVFLILLQRLFSVRKDWCISSFGTLHMKSEVPFAPFLIIGFLLVYFCNLDVLKLLII